jgi:hypothetical protein
MAIEHYLSIKGNKQGQFKSAANKIAVSSFQWGGSAVGALGAKQTITIGGDRTENVGANQTINVAGNQTENVGANQTITVGGNQSENVGGDQTITLGGNRVETVGSHTINFGVTRATLTITKAGGAEDSQFSAALVLRERLQIQYSHHWTAGHRLAVATLTSAIVTGIHSVGRLKEITFRFVT